VRQVWCTDIQANTDAVRSVLAHIPGNITLNDTCRLGYTSPSTIRVTLVIHDPRRYVSPWLYITLDDTFHLGYASPSTIRVTLVIHHPRQYVSPWLYITLDDTFHLGWLYITLHDTCHLGYT